VRVEQLQREYDVVVEWRAFLLDPTTPPEGKPYPYPPEVRAQRSGPIRAMAAEVGLTIADRDFVANSQLALQAAEYARDQGLFEPFHRAVFDAYFAEGRDIGKLDELRAIARTVGLDEAGLVAALEEQRYAERVLEDVTLASQIGITAVPAFIIGNRAIMGAQPYEVFEQVMELYGREKVTEQAPG
jgi:predicted DsbA family dithiol-disulfide isomerase